MMTLLENYFHQGFIIWLKITHNYCYKYYNPTTKYIYPTTDCFTYYKHMTKYIYHTTDCLHILQPYDYVHISHNWPLTYNTTIRSFYNNFLIKINKMLPLFNFCIKVFARIDTCKYVLSCSQTYFASANMVISKCNNKFYISDHIVYWWVELSQHTRQDAYDWLLLI